VPLLILGVGRMAKIVENDRMMKRYVLRKRVYKMRSQGHDWNFIARKLGFKEANIRTVLV